MGFATEVCHGSYAKEDQGRKDTPLIQSKEIPQKTADAVGRFFRRIHDFRIDIYKQHAKCDGDQQQRRKSPADCQV